MLMNTRKNSDVLLSRRAKTSEKTKKKKKKDRYTFFNTTHTPSANQPPASNNSPKPQAESGLRNSATEPPYPAHQFQSTLSLIRVWIYIDCIIILESRTWILDLRTSPSISENKSQNTSGCGPGFESGS
ncbi:unnamed protein product [Ixodes persulcatus]